MSFVDASLIGGVSDPRGDSSIVGKHVSGNSGEDISGNPENLEILRCFVCDVRVEGRRYALATCKTQNSRTRVIEKLGELVGERYVVVITEDDVICRSCANLINTLDRLEAEMRCAKNSVLRFLERKYSLDEGELIRCSEIPRLGQPPRITKRDPRRSDYHSRKQGALRADEYDDAERREKRSKDSKVWMQCDKCRYTTRRDTFALRHAKRRAENRHENQADEGNVAGTENQNEAEPRAIQTAPLETIDLASTADDVDEDLTAVPVVSIASAAEAQTAVTDEQIQFISLANPSALQLQNFLNDGCPRDGQPLLMRVLQQFTVGDDLGQVNLLPVMNSEAVTKAKENAPKQMLTLAEDGSLEMVAVDCWNEEDNRNVRIPEDAT